MLRRTVVLLTAAAGLASGTLTRSPAEEAVAPGRFYVGGPAVASIDTSAGAAQRPGPGAEPPDPS